MSLDQYKAQNEARWRAQSCSTGWGPAVRKSPHQHTVLQSISELDMSLQEHGAIYNYKLWKSQ